MDTLTGAVKKVYKDLGTYSNFYAYRKNSFEINNDGHIFITGRDD